VGIETGEIRREVDPRRAAILIISSLEGALTISRLERDREALLGVQSHLRVISRRTCGSRPGKPISAIQAGGSVDS
jgi:TetR/AcrR family transcriptional repressor of nem operon